MSNLIKAGSIISVTGKKWFDNGAGNTYFRALIQVDGEIVAKLPFQYGYGDHYLDESTAWLAENDYIENPRKSNGSRTPLWLYCEKNNIRLDYSSYDVKTQNRCKSSQF